MNAAYKAEVEQIYQEELAKATPEERATYDKYKRAHLLLSRDTPTLQRIAAYGLEDQLEKMPWFKSMTTRIEECCRKHFGG